MGEAKSMGGPGEGAGAGRVRFSVSSKILFWFFLNLLFLVLAAALVVRVQFQLGLNSFLSGKGGERLQAMSEMIIEDFRERDPKEWPILLKRFSTLYNVQIAVFRSDGQPVAGEIAEPPALIREKLVNFQGFRPGDRERLPGGGPDRGGPPNGGPRNGRPPEDGGRRDGRPENLEGPGNRFGPPGAGRPGSPPRVPLTFLEDNGPGGPGGPGGPPQPGAGAPLRGPGGGGYPKFIERAGSPSLYWIGVRVPINHREIRPPGPMTLLIASKSLSSGGLLFDVTPWLLIGGAVLLGSGLLWLPLVRGITRSLAELQGAAGRMAQGQFDTRVSTGRSDELGLLGASLNNMAGRLQEFVTGQKRFLGDIAHELCSPLARMELALGVLDQRADEKQRAYVADVRDEVREMSALLNELLSFTKAGLRAEIKLVAVALADCASRAAGREGDDQASVIVDISPALIVMAEPQLLARAIGNVVRNAVRYAGKAGPISLTAQARGAQVILLICDQGPGVPAATLNRLFDPFFRPEAARTRETGGTGLGLAIVKSCVEACGGSVAVRNGRPAGLEVEITLSRAPAGQD